MDKTISDLGANLAALARTDDDLGCLQVFAELVASGQPMPTLLGVVVGPDGARIVTVGNPNPGLTLQIDDDLAFDVTQLWFDGGRHPGAKKRSRHLRVVPPT